MREWVKALPLGLGLPDRAASVKPEDAASNIAAWLQLLGVEHVPSWLTAPGVDNHVILGSLGVGAIYAFLVWGVPALRHGGKPRTPHENEESLRQQLFDLHKLIESMKVTLEADSIVNEVNVDTFHEVFAITVRLVKLGIPIPYLPKYEKIIQYENFNKKMYQYFSAISPFLRDGDIKLATIWAEQTLEQFIPSPSAPSPTATVPVHPLFLRAYERYRNELGMQMREAIPQWSVYQAAFARGIAIWTHQMQKNFIFTLSDERWTGRSDIMATDEWGNDKEKIRRRLGIGRNREVPQGGIAKWIFEEPNKKNELGDLSWVCLLDGRVIFRQDFEHGMMIGPLRVRNKGDDSGQVLILISDDSEFRSGRWKQETIIGVKATDCVAPVWGDDH